MFGDDNRSEERNGVSEFMKTYYPGSYDDMVMNFVRKLRELTDPDRPESYSIADLASMMSDADGSKLAPALLSRMIGRKRDGDYRPVGELAGITLERVYQLMVALGNTDANELLGVKPQFDISNLSDEIQENVKEMTEAQIEQWILHGRVIIEGRDMLDSINVGSKEQRLEDLYYEIKELLGK